MSQLLGTLRHYFVQLEAVRHINIASCNINLDTLITTDVGARDGDVWVDGNILKVAGLAGGGGTVTTTNSVTFNNGGAGAASGATFNGASAVTVSYNTVGAAAASHTHSYLPLTGGILTGNLRVETASYPMIQVRDTALAADARQWALYVAPTDGGVRLAPTTDAGSAASGLNIDRSGNASLPRLQLTAGDDAGLASTLHPLQIGATNGGNIIADSNEIMARNNGAATTLYLNNDGGAIQLGGQLTINPVGNSTIMQGTAPASANGAVYLAREAGYTMSLVFRTGASNRWTFQVTSGAETGSNAGSNFSLYRYDDAGTVIDAPFAVTRSTGVVAFTQTPTVGGTAVSLAGHTHSYLPLTGGTLTGIVAVSHTAPQIGFIQTDGAVNEKNTRFTVDGTGWDIRLFSDDYASYTTPLRITRSGTTATAIAFTATTVTVNGTAVSLSTHNHAGVYQPLDADLTAIAALAGTSGLLRKTAADTWSLDTATYITGNQSITFSGDASGSGTTAVTLTLATVNSNTGSFGAAATVPVITVNGKGLITAVSTATITPAAIGALSLGGGTMTGVITTPNNAHGIIVGDDSRLADRNVSNTLFVEGVQNNDRGYINFGSTTGNALGAINAGDLTWRGAALALEAKLRSSATTSGTLTAAEAGKVLKITAAVTINPSVFAADDVVAIYNNTAGDLSITQGTSMTLRKSGTATTGTLTLAQRGWATLWFVSASEAVVSGNV
jgi:hypothetical protein